MGLSLFLFPFLLSFVLAWGFIGTGGSYQVWCQFSIEALCNRTCLVFEISFHTQVNGPQDSRAYFIVCIYLLYVIRSIISVSSVVVKRLLTDGRECPVGFQAN